MIRFKEEKIEVNNTKHQWIGTANYESDYYCFDDINIIRISGNDTVDLTNVIVTGMDNIIVIRKIFGNTTILVPIDVTVTLDVSSIYGSVDFLDVSNMIYNESIKLKETDNQSLKKSKLSLQLLPEMLRWIGDEKTLLCSCLALLNHYHFIYCFCGHG